MTFEYTGSYRLGEGEITPGSFDETYNIDLFPRQDDQPSIVDWLPEPLEGSDVFKDYQELVEDMAGGAGTWGNSSFDWFTGYWTPLMCKYFLDRFFANGAGSIRVTVMTFDRAYGFRTVYATMRRPDFASAEAVGTGYSKIKIPFVNVVSAV